MASRSSRMATLGGGNLGVAPARGWIAAGTCAPQDLRVTRRQSDRLRPLAEAGVCTGSDNVAAVRAADTVVVAVQPQQVKELLLEAHAHPESEIDRVTTPRGCTIGGLNEMEHRGFSSAMIKGIVHSARQAAELYRSSEGGEPGAADAVREPGGSSRAG